MTFDEFINCLNQEDAKNYKQYSPIRGVQIYKIIFRALYNVNKDYDFSYSDLNAFVKYDKSIKDVLYTYLGTLEDFIRREIFDSFDLKTGIKYQKRYLKYDEIKDKVIRFDNTSNEVTELYSRWSLMFGDTILFMKNNNMPNHDYDKLELIRQLRNDVMHHGLLLFESNATSKAKETSKYIKALISELPKQYDSIKSKINQITKAAKSNMQQRFNVYLLEVF